MFPAENTDVCLHFSAQPAYQIFISCTCPDDRSRTNKPARVQNDHRQSDLGQHSWTTPEPGLPLGLSDTLRTHVSGSD